MNLCIRCIIPDSFPGITFQDGICSLCRQREASPRNDRVVLGKDRLLEKLDSGISGEYHCTVPLSGGKDSSYILHYLVRKLGKNPLALYFDNGFSHDMAKKNIEKLCNHLGVDLVTGRATAYRRKIITESLKIISLIPKDSLSICGNCENNLRTFVINESVRRNIPFIIWGATDFEDKAANSLDSRTHRESFGTFGFTMKLMRRRLSAVQRTGVQNRFRLIIPAMRRFYYTIRDNFETDAPGGCRKLNPYLQVSFRNKNIEALYFFKYIQYDPYNHIRVLQNETDWESPPDHEMRMDCRLHVFENYWDVKNRGLSADGFVLATLVRNNLLDRNEAIRKEESLQRSIEKDYHELMSELAG